MKTNQIIKNVERDEIDLSDLAIAIGQGKWTIISITLIFSIVAVFYSLYLPNIYQSEVTLAPVAEQNGLQIPGQLGGLAALAGVNLGGAGGSDKAGLALEILKSRDFISRFIERNDLYLPIMAAEGWDRSSDKLLIDSKIFDEKTGQWGRKVKPPFKVKPSNLETFEEFEKLFAVSLDKTSGMVTLSVQHYSPYLAKNWIDMLVNAINEEMRQRDLIEAEKSITYLNNQIAQTHIADVRTMLYSLIEEQTKTVMLANVRDEYVFKTIDPAVVAEKKAKPARALIVILVFLLGVIISSLIVLIRYYSKKN
jgi:uncharacterized protein involved in exopolysaccharide biosynthesis